MVRFLMKSSPIVLRLRWTHGHSQIIQTRSHFSIEEVLSSHGFPSRALVACKGKIIDPVFSFGYYNITSGATLVCHEKTHGSPVCRKGGFCRCVHRMEDCAEAVLDKLEDQTFTLWELGRQFPLVLKELLSEEAQSVQEVGRDQFATIVPQVQTINDTPMPMPLSRKQLERAVGFVGFN
jgi:hypothetical protein